MMRFMCCSMLPSLPHLVTRSKDISADMWLDELNDAILVATGLDQLGLVQAPLDEEDLTQAELLEQQRLLAEAARSDTPPDQ